jgi:hypothetical protein
VTNVPAGRWTSQAIFFTPTLAAKGLGPSDSIIYKFRELCVKHDVSDLGNDEVIGPCDPHRKTRREKLAWLVRKSASETKPEAIWWIMLVTIQLVFGMFRTLLVNMQLVTRLQCSLIEDLNAWSTDDPAQDSHGDKQTTFARTETTLSTLVC